MVSLKLPFFPFARGVRMARVMTMSSAFLDVLLSREKFRGSVHMPRPSAGGRNGVQPGAGDAESLLTFGRGSCLVSGA